MASRLIDAVLPAWQFEERHERRVAAPPARVLDAVAGLSLAADPVCRALLGLRGGVGPRAGFSMAAFTPLGRTPTEIAWGLAGRFWRPDGGLLPPAADAEAFRGPLPPGTARLVWSFQAMPLGPGATRLRTVTRVHCPDRAALLRFTPYWVLIRPFSGLIRRRLLSAIARQAEASGDAPS